MDQKYGFGHLSLLITRRFVLPFGAWTPRTEKATRGNAERKVEVEVVLGAKSTSFLVVRDNGCGMDAKGLEDFATYYLSPVSCNSIPSGELCDWVRNIERIQD